VADKEGLDTWDWNPDSWKHWRSWNPFQPYVGSIFSLVNFCVGAVLWGFLTITTFMRPSHGGFVWWICALAFIGSAAGATRDLVGRHLRKRHPDRLTHP
jgi:hypothetical protein